MSFTRAPRAIDLTRSPIGNCGFCKRAIRERELVLCADCGYAPERLRVLEDDEDGNQFDLRISRRERRHLLDIIDQLGDVVVTLHLEHRLSEREEERLEGLFKALVNALNMR